VLGVVVVVSLVAAQVYDTVQGCGSVDPTDPANYTEGHIVNDTTSPVTIDACAGAFCGSNDVSKPLAPGQSQAVRGDCGASKSDMTSWRVSRDGQTLGYLAIGTGESRHGVEWAVSRLSDDRQTPTVPLSPGKKTG
jgi:hypothetical protein